MAEPIAPANQPAPQALQAPQAAESAQSSEFSQSPESAQSEQWYIVKQESGVCQILSVQTAEAAELNDREKWGPFGSQGQAIARRVGLIRSGKCQPQ